MGTKGHIRGSAFPLRRWIRRTPLLVFSLLLAACGLALIAVSAVGMLSSSDPAPEHQTVRHLAVQPDSIYDRYVPQATPAPTHAPTATPEPTPIVPPLGDEPFVLVIPSIDVDAPVNPYGLDANLVPEVPRNGYEVAWYNWSAEPGTGGNAVFAGHVTWQGLGVFYHLDQLDSGDEIILRGEDGAELAYTVEDNFLVDPSDPGALSVMGPTDDDTVTIITCGGTFYYDSSAQFGGEYTNRRVVRAHLSRATPAPAVGVAGSGS